MNKTLDFSIVKDRAALLSCVKWGDCQACEYGKFAHMDKPPYRVFFKGNPNANAFFLGEGPGGNEILMGRPFVGRAGEQLLEMLEWAEIPTGDCIVANTMVCSITGKEKPTAQSMDKCQFWHELYNIVKPKLVVCLGSYAIQAFSHLGKPPIMSRLLGQIQPHPSVVLFSEYHPAYLLRNPSAKTAAKERWMFIGKKYRELV